MASKEYIYFLFEVFHRLEDFNSIFCPVYVDFCCDLRVGLVSPLTRKKEREVGWGGGFSGKIERIYFQHRIPLRKSITEIFTTLNPSFVFVVITLTYY